MQKYSTSAESLSGFALSFVVGALNTNGEAAGDSDDFKVFAVVEDDAPKFENKELEGAEGVLACDVPKPAKVKGVGEGVCGN